MDTMNVIGLTISLVISALGLIVAVLAHRRNAPRPKISMAIPAKFDHTWADAIEAELLVVNNGASALKVTNVRCVVTSHFGDECDFRTWTCAPVQRIKPFTVPKFDGLSKKIKVPLSGGPWSDIGEQGQTKIALLVETSRRRRLKTRHHEVELTWRDRMQR